MSNTSTFEQIEAAATLPRPARVIAAGWLLLTLCVMPASAETRAIASALPAPGIYSIDPVHTFAYFGAWHHMVGLVRGRFEQVTGTITVAPDLADCAVDIRIDASSISTQNHERDEDLRGPDFFDVKKFPVMTYRGRSIRRAAGNKWILNGSLSIRGVTRVVPLTITFHGLFPDTPAGKPARAAFHASAEVKRGDFGMTRDNLMELGPSPAPSRPDVEIELDVEADAKAAAH